MMAARPQQQQPGRHVLEGDVVYYSHPQEGVSSARVCAVGAHGVTVEHKAGPHKVRWDRLLGHKQRRGRKLTMVERGEDGGIALDEDGKRVFVHGSLPVEDAIETEDDPLAKALPVPGKPLLVDIGHLHGAACDHALESLQKALNEGDGAAFDIWMEHDNPFIRELVEQFSKRGLTKLGHVEDALQGWLAGQFHVPTKKAPAVPPGFVGHWSQAEMDLVRIYLQSIDPLGMELDDWSMLIDYLVQRYMPPETLLEEAEWLAAKANVMGRVEAHMGTIEAAAAGAILRAAPGSVSEALHAFAYSDAEEVILRYGKETACNAIVGLSADARRRLKSVVLDHQRRKLAGDVQSDGDLQMALFDKFDSLNRDWRRIAVTEAGEMANQGVIAHLEPGSQVRRMEMYRGACGFCRSLDGKVYRVTSADDPDKNGDTDVWPGKTNMGRSASAQKRLGGELVPREPHEKYWAAAGVQHPHCRGRWDPVAAPPANADPKFTSWLAQRLAETR